MASTYSTSLRLELMATGDQSGTWGDTTNTNLGTLLEQAITGVLSVAQGDTTLTLTSTDGASDQARNAVVNLTGAMTGAQNVIVPTSNKVYLIKNSTTGGFAVTVKTATGTGVAVLPGTNRLVYCDGTNVVAGDNNLQTLSLTALSPETTDALALGTTSLMWSDLFLASGGVINWNNGDVLVTHSANTLAFTGASSGYTFDAPVTGTVTLGTEQASTSGTSIDFTSVPSWAKKITVMFVGVSTTGTDRWLIQIGDSGGVENTGYLGASTLIQNGSLPGTTLSTAGFILDTQFSAGVLHGAITLSLENAATFTWVASGSISNSDVPAVTITSGSKSLSAVLDRVRITTTGGANTFDAGVINVSYQG